MHVPFLGKSKSKFICRLNKTHFDKEHKLEANCQYGVLFFQLKWIGGINVHCAICAFINSIFFF